jgi:hypothetical protein
MLSKEIPINWRHKAAVQKLLSSIPQGEQVNYLLSKYVTAHVPASDATFRRDVSFATQYLDAFRKYGCAPIEEGLFFEFGGGWDLIVALAFYSLGVNRQVVVDLRRLLRPALVAMTAKRLNLLAGNSRCMRPLSNLSGRIRLQPLVRTLKANFGIEYAAPFDARKSGWKSESIDYITATKVLCDIPQPDLQLIMAECHRLLNNDGLAAFVIDYRDQYSYTDSTIGPYNFLQFTDDQWARFNPPLHYQNRMRHSDYVRLFEQAGFELVVAVGAPPDRAIDKTFDPIKLTKRFASYDVDDLKILRGDFVLRKKSL